MRKAFSLVELLVTISIIAVIVGLSLVAFGPARKSARDAKRQADIESIRTALELYRSENGEYPMGTDIGSLSVLSPTFIETVPPDPLSTTRVYDYNALKLDGTSCTLVAETCVRYKLCAGLENNGISNPNCSTVAPTVSCGPGIACSHYTKNP